MKVFLGVLLLSGLMVTAGCSPLFARKFTDWSNPHVHASYRERLQSWGLYPKVFRYGTTNPHEAIMERKRAELSWLTRIVRENEEVHGYSNGQAETSNRRRHQYEKFKEKHFQKMEQDALEVLWQHG